MEDIGIPNQTFFRKFLEVRFQGRLISLRGSFKHHLSVKSPLDGGSFRYR
jgi:hypothetical protein